MSSKTSYTGTDYRKKRRKLNSPTDMHGWRTGLMVCGYISIFFGATLPMTYWAVQGFSETSMQYAYQAWLFVFLIYAGIMNFVFGWYAIKLSKTEKYSDMDLINKQHMFLSWAPVLMISGALVVGVIFIALWRSTSKRKKFITWSDDSKAKKFSEQNKIETQSLDNTLKTTEENKGV